MDQKNIRNFCIIAHIDHGKSTLCDRLLEITGTLNKRDLKEQTLDHMDLERERGITIKLQPVKMRYSFQGGNYNLNLIDTPGHVDFGYEVSRSLAAVEGAILLVDAVQGIQAQTLANLYLALEENLIIIPVINKIDLANAEVEQVEEALASLLGGSKKDIIKVSAKTGEGVPKVLESIVKDIPAPQGFYNKPARALIFDSCYDDYKGVIAYVRVVDGEFARGEKIFALKTRKGAEIIEAGIFNPQLTPQKKLATGQIGYLATGLKDVSECRVGDTITLESFRQEAIPLKGYQEVKPMVFASFYPKSGENYNQLRDALEKLSLNDAAFVYNPESSQALGRGFRGGFLGLLHLEIIQERLRREFNQDLIFTTPSVQYQVKLKGKDKKIIINSPLELPDASTIDFILEPWVKLEIITTSNYIGGIMKYLASNRAIYKDTIYLNPQRATLVYEIPLSQAITNLHDALKNASQGYASMSYEFLEFRVSKLVKLDILIAGDLREELSRIVPQNQARKIGLSIVNKLKNNLERQNFSVAIQAAVNSTIIARETLSALRKDVLAKLYGGDRTRKDKLLKKQKKGKKKLEGFGKVTIPPKVYLEIMKK
jgi:GTP-binding protein LepA